jgi:hypothetical protein
VFDVLLLAGYFRCRIPRISVFDKILGGMIWAISLSNFELDIYYEDDLKLGAKIRLSEKVIKALKKMQCPFKLEPHQLSSQNIDFKAIFPVVQWLIKSVYKTREEREELNHNMVNFLGGKTLAKKDEVVAEEMVRREESVELMKKL